MPEGGGGIALDRDPQDEAVSDAPRAAWLPSSDAVLGLIDRRETVLVIAALTAFTLAAGITYLVGSGSGPTLPYLPVGGVHEVEEPVVDHDRDILFVPLGDEIKAFDASGPAPRYCPQSGRLESEDGRVWDLNGRALDGGTPLEAYRVKVYGSTIYVDLSSTEPVAGRAEATAQPRCRS